MHKICTCTTGGLLAYICRMKHRFFGGIFFILLAPISFSQPVYNYYRGNLHAHTSYSDGSKDCNTSHVCTPAEAYQYAKGSLEFDFLGISEHNHASAGMQLNHYAMGLSDAAQATDSSFVALYGMEWGVISTGGHLLIYGYDSLIGWDTQDYDVYNAQTDYDGLFARLTRHKGAIAMFAHPQSGDYSGLFSNSRNLIIDSCLVGSAVRSGPAFSTNTNYGNPVTSTYISRFNDALKRGYRIAPGIDHDNHYTTFGRHTPARTMVLATSLTPQNLLDAYRKLRFYASDDWNAFVDFSVNGQIMGSEFAHAGQAQIHVQVNDQDNENTQTIKIYYGIAGSGTAPTVLQNVSGTSTLDFGTTSLQNNTTYYFYAEIRQADGDYIWTSPVWFTRDDTQQDYIPNPAFQATSPNAFCENGTVSFLDFSSNTPTAWHWEFPGGVPATSTLPNPVIQYNTPGNYAVKLRVTNSDGTDSIEIPNYVIVSPLPPTPVIVDLGNGNLLCTPPATQYQWYVNGYTIVTGTDSILPNTLPGYSYTVITTNAYGCKSGEGVYLGMESGQPVFSVYPNPATELVQVQLQTSPQEPFEVDLLDLQGRVIHTQHFSGETDNFSVFLGGLPPGLYLLRVQLAASAWIETIQVN